MVDGDSIQIDKGGYVRVHYAIFEFLAKAPLRGQQFRCLMFLFRKTYGYNKKEDSISLQQWADGTGLKRQNVWRELQLLIKCKVIYMRSSGPKRANTWGFNKRHEQWQLESVIAEDDSQSVITDDYSCEPSVITDDDKSVITPHERTKDNKDKLPTAIDDEDGNDVMALIRLAYENVCKVGPPMQSDDGKANLITASGLIEKYGFPACIRSLTTLRERNDAMIRKNARNGIRAPLGYLRTIMDDEGDTPIPTPITTKVDFALEEII